MNILILSSSNPTKTAGVVALDLYKGLKNINHIHVKLLVKQYDRYSDRDIIPVVNRLAHHWNKPIRKIKTLSTKIRRKIQPSYRKLNPDYAVQDYNPINTYYDSNFILKKAGFTPEAIIVLFMPKFLSFKNLYELNKSTKAPVFIYPMDMGPMTGGCHYAWDCKGYQNRCGFCPAYCSNEENDQSRENWYFKKKFIDQTDISAFYGNEQLHYQLQKSSLYKSIPKYKVPISINDSVFRPGEMKKARDFFGLPLEKKMIFFGATNVNQKRKGFCQLLETLKIVNNLAKDKLDIHLSIAGKIDDSSELRNIFNYSLLGSLNHEHLALAFQAADVFLCPSIEDSGPMMINQSIMCGTPVAAFETGAAPDLVIADKTGYVAKLKDCKDLAQAIMSILNLETDEYMKMRKNCSELGVTLLSPKVQADKILDAIGDRLDRNII